MNIISKQIEMSNVVTVFGDKFFLPSPAHFMSLFGQEGLKGSNFVDDTAMRIVVFEMPALKFRYVFENKRFRIEETGFRYPDESKCAIEMHRIIESLYKNIPTLAFGFNYDAIFKFDNVIPQREIMGNFIKKEKLDYLKDFGWQFSLEKEKGKKLETYFIKAVSPIELRVHANFHFNQATATLAEEFQVKLENSYKKMDEMLKDFSF